MPWSRRLLHSPSLVAIGLSVGYETWRPIGWHRVFVIGWSKYRLDCLVPHSIIGWHGQWEFPLFFRPQWQSLCTALMAGKCLSWGLCKGLWKSLLISMLAPAMYYQLPSCTSLWVWVEIHDWTFAFFCFSWLKTQSSSVGKVFVTGNLSTALH